MKMNKNNAGLAAEEIAAAYLAQQGLKLVMRNYHCRFGEIDLIMLDGKTTVFVEVKLRTSSRFGGAHYSIPPQKQQKLILAAQHYLQSQADNPCRFDALLIKDEKLQDIAWIRNAFEV